MRRVHRQPLSTSARQRLCDLTWEIAASGHGLTTIGARSNARKKTAKSLWDNRTDNKDFKEIREKLAAMAPGTGLCMYCEVSIGDAIEHFWPKEKYPGRVFSWENYLWACSICNSTHKGNQFPRDENGAPLLINPADEDPRDHLEFSPTTGKLAGLTPKGAKTVETLGFERRGDLDKARKNAWDGLQSLIVWYGIHCKNGEAWRALQTQRTICQHVFATALGTLLQCARDPRLRSLLHPECVSVVERHPEILDWP